MKKYLLFLLLLTLSVFLKTSIVEAGGEYWQVVVQEEIVKTKPMTIKLSLIDAPEGIIAGCQTIVVHVKHQTVPFWAWLPFITTIHPTQKETMDAIDFLNRSHKASIEAYFGYIGGGLPKEPKGECVFNSKGLRLEHIEDAKRDVVFSFFDPV